MVCPHVDEHFDWGFEADKTDGAPVVSFLFVGRLDVFGERRLQKVLGRAVQAHKKVLDPSVCLRHVFAKVLAGLKSAQHKQKACLKAIPSNKSYFFNTGFLSLASSRC